MNDTISRAMALEVIEAMMNLAGRQGGKVLCGKLYAQIKDLPATDAVPVVRCKNCEHYYEEQGSCDLHDERGPDGEIEYRFYVTPNWFCADGETEND